MNANGFAITGSVSGQTTEPVADRAQAAREAEGEVLRVGANARKTVKLKLPAALKRTLRRTGKLSLRLTARVKDPAGNTRTVKKKVTPRLKRPAGC